MIHPTRRWLGIASLVSLAALFLKIHPSFRVPKGLLLACLMELALIGSAVLIEKWSPSTGSAHRSRHLLSWHHLGPWLTRD
jgi:hypothetical protein